MQDDWGPDTSKRPTSSHASRLDSSALIQLMKDRLSSRVYQTLLGTRQRLPVFQHRDKVMDRINRENVVVVAGETGSGKSTQIPQFVLEVSKDTSSRLEVLFSFCRIMIPVWMS